MHTLTKKELVMHSTCRISWVRALNSRTTTPL